jgi:hypothetical protein
MLRIYNRIPRGDPKDFLGNPTVPQNPALETLHQRKKMYRQNRVQCWHLWTARRDYNQGLLPTYWNQEWPRRLETDVNRCLYSTILHNTNFNISTLFLACAHIFSIFYHIMVITIIDVKTIYNSSVCHMLLAVWKNVLPDGGWMIAAETCWREKNNCAVARD